MGKSNYKVKEGAKDLRIEQVQVPDYPTLDGTIINCETISIGIWLMPNNSSSGELENFIRKMIPKNDSIWPSAEKYIENIPEESLKFDNNKIEKAQLFAWLATRKKTWTYGSSY